MLVVFSLCSVFLWRKNSISFILGMLVVVTSLFALLINRTPDLTSANSLWIQLYVIAIMFLGVNSFKEFYSLKEVRIKSGTELFYKRLLDFVLITGFVALIINAYIVFKSFNLILASTVTVEEYKNQGGAANYLTSWVPPVLITYSHFISPLGYVALASHFFFLANKRIGKSVLFLLVSLNLPLHGLHALSRSDSVQYLILYVLLLVIVFPLISSKIRRNISISVLFVFGGLVFLLSVITTTRFEDKSVSRSNAVVQNSSVYSVLEYGGQWQENGMNTLVKYNDSKLMYGASAGTILRFYAQRIGMETESYDNVRRKALGRKYTSTFNGLPSTLVYDFGYFFAFMFMFLYAYLVRSNAPKKGVLTLDNLIHVSLLLPVIAMFFGNNSLSSFSLGMACVYMLFLNIAKRVKI